MRRDKLKLLYFVFFFISFIFLLLQFIIPMAIASSPIFFADLKLNLIVLQFCDWVYSFGSLICHQRADRSFFICEVQMPICIRCLGMTIGIFLSSIISVIVIPSGKLADKLKQFYFLDEKSSCIKLSLIIFLFMFPMIIDGFFQILFSYNSIEITRFITGLLFGYFEGSLFISIISSFIPLINNLFYYRAFRKKRES